MQPEDGKGDEMQASESRGQPLVVTGQAAEAGHPAMAPFHHSAPWQVDETTFGVGQSGAQQFDALTSYRLGRLSVSTRRRLALTKPSGCLATWVAASLTDGAARINRGPIPTTSSRPACPLASPPTPFPQVA